ncbi:T9SS type A sorting domain-containing protein [Salegentibacter chungangensis]|uniref:T9SS type A sorting domain-containing protein n=1 Tax=Salegentibacter chungangensis TaxID=1335724 RepID=A0ABW3NSG5_9FLAO
MPRITPRNSMLFSAFLVVILLFSIDSYSQSIDNPVINTVQQCAGTQMNITFTVTNGSGSNGGGPSGNGAGGTGSAPGSSNKYFLTTTEYIITLIDNNNAYSTELLRYTPGEAPEASGGASKTFSTSVSLPNDLVYSSTYRISVTSVNPEPQGQNFGTSLEFEILPIIKSNTIDAAQFGCNPYVAQTLNGSIPTGGDGTYTYKWESSTTGPSTGFSPASGITNSKNYDPGTLSQTTWYRRITTSGSCIDLSNSVEINITNDNVWIGTNGTNWNDPSNWNCNAVPISVTNVIIPSGLVNYPVLNAGNPGIANNINIESGAKLSVTDNTLELKGYISNSGSFDTRQGTIAFSGTTSQTIPAGSFLNNKIENLISNNPAGIDLQGELGISGYLLPQTGIFNTNGNLTLLSDANQTALIEASETGSVNGEVTMQRYLDSAFGYKYFSSPFTSLNVSDFGSYIDLSNTFPQVYRYEENREKDINGTGKDASGWLPHTGGLNIGEGYAFNFGASSSPVTVELTGTVNDGSYSIDLSNHDGIYTKGFNLVGNPYPSPIDWDASGWTKDNIDGGIYFFNASTDDPYGGTYTSYVNGVQSADGKSSNIIPSMQGFFVHVRDPSPGTVTTGTLGMTNNVRVMNYSQPFLRTFQNAPESKPLIRLRAGFEEQASTDAAVVYFSTSARSEFEQDKDALKLMNTDVNVPSLFSLTSESKQVSINGISTKGISDINRIPLGIKTERSGWINIELSELENISSGLNIYLIDNKERTAHNLKNNGSYNFRMDTGADVSRFELVLSKQPITDPAIAFNDAFSVDNRFGQVKVYLNLENGEKGLLRANNVSGQVLDAREVSGKQSIEIRGIRSSGIYIISLQTGKRKYSKKIIIKK